MIIAYLIGIPCCTVLLTVLWHWRYPQVEHDQTATAAIAMQAFVWPVLVGLIPLVILIALLMTLSSATYKYLERRR